MPYLNLMPYLSQLHLSQLPYLSQIWPLAMGVIASAVPAVVIRFGWRRDKSATES